MKTCMPTNRKTKRTFATLLLLVSSAVLAVSSSCSQSSDAEVYEEDEETGLSILAVNRDLGPGDSGSDVRAVYAHLRDYGYFPNSDLKERYPHWFPIVSETPNDPSVYGDALEKAIMSLQSYVGLPATGRIDAATREVLHSPRCGHPESGVSVEDPSEKWSQLADANGVPFRWNQINIRFRITAYDGVNTTTADNALTAALNRWNAQSFLNLTRTTGSAFEVEIKFWGFTTPPAASELPAGWPQFASNNTTAHAFQASPPSGLFNRIGVNTNANNFTQFDLQSVLQHEIGHVLGFWHASVGNNPGPCTSPGTLTTTCPVMWPFLGANTVRTNFDVDDRQALGLLYNQWNSKVGFALDLGAGGTAATPRIWATSSGNTLFYWKNNTWNLIPGNGVAVAVDDAGLAWAVSSDGTIWQGSAADPTIFGFVWNARSNGSGARDIAASNGQVWIVSNTAAAGDPSNFVIRQRSGNSWSSANGGVGTRIAVDWAGRPWVVQANGSVWRRYGSGDTINQTGGAGPTWQVISQLNPPAQGQLACARDIGAGRDHSVWVIGCTAVSGSDLAIWMWNEQAAFSDVPTQAQFRLADGFGVRITASPDSRPWVSQANGNVFRRSINAAQQ